MTHHVELDEDGRVLVMSSLARKNGLKRGMAIVLIIMVAAGPVAVAYRLIHDWLVNG